VADYVSHEEALRSSIRARIFVGVGLIAALGLAAWITVYWSYRPESGTSLKSPATARAVLAPKPVGAHDTQFPANSPQVPTQTETSLECAECIPRAVRQRLAERLKPDFADVSATIQNDSASEASAGYDRVIRLLQLAKAASAERRPDLLLAADVFAERLDLSDKYPPTPDVQTKIDELAGYRLTFRWSEMGADYHYDHELLWSLWKDHPETAAGEDAFLLLLNSGWDTGARCAKGTDAFRSVIREADQFLSARPNSQRRLEVQFLAAQAYETWWSLSRSPEGKDQEAVAAPEQYQQGAEAARLKAIAYYEEVQSKAAGSAAAKCAARSVEPLKQAKPTQDLRFFCYCD